MADSEAVRTWRKRARKKGLIPPVPICSTPGCGSRHTGTYGELCKKCWSKTPEGKEHQRLRIQQYRDSLAFAPASKLLELDARRKGKTDHPAFPQVAWLKEVRDKRTALSYWEWVAERTSPST